MNVQVRDVSCLFFLLYANLLVLVTLCEGNHYPFIEERYKLNLRNSLLFAEIFNATFLFGLNDPFKPFAKLRFFYFYSKYLDERQSRMSSN